MSGNIRQRLANEKKKIEARLESAVQYNDGGPVIAATNIHYEFANRTKAIAHGGIGAIHLLVLGLALPAKIN